MCFCPRANYCIERCLPDFSVFSKLRDRLCLGTDSYASNYTFNFAEEIGFLNFQNFLNKTKFDFESVGSAGAAPAGFTADTTGRGKAGVWVLQQAQGAPALAR